LRGVDFCRGCQSKDLFRALDLGFSPLANSLIPADSLEAPETWLPLVLRVCKSCSLGQLGEFAGETEIFRDYPYLSSTSSTWLEANKEFANQTIDLLDLTSNDLVLELASNDGYMLQFFSEQGIPVIGVEPALNVATEAALKGIPTSPEFFSTEFAHRISRRGVNPRLIVAKNVLAHVPDIRDFIGGIGELTSQTTMVVIEAPSILNILNKIQFDTVYHEHFSYVSATFFQKVLSEFNLKLVGAEVVATHGGSLRLYIARDNTLVLLEEKFQDNLLRILDEEKAAGVSSSENWQKLADLITSLLNQIRNWVSNPPGRLIGYGAAAKAVTLLSAAQTPRGSIKYCIDNSSAKAGRYIPGSSTLIVSEKDYFETLAEEGDVFIVFPWNLTSEIAPRIREKRPDARIFIALPSLMEV